MPERYDLYSVATKQPLTVSTKIWHLTEDLYNATVFCKAKISARAAVSNASVPAEAGEARGPPRQRAPHSWMARL